METLDTAKFIEPHTLGWKEARLGKFTSSEIHKLFAGGKRKMTETELLLREKGDRKTTTDTLFGDGALTYIKVKIAEILTGETNNPTSMAMDWGLSNERDAILRYEVETGIKTRTSGFYTHNSVFGGSPDSEVGINGILEVKCPFASENHIAISLCETVEDLRDFNECYYTQPQGNMFVTGTKWCDFISYDPRCKNEKFQIKIIRIHRDDEFIREMLYRIEEASVIMNDYLTSLLS